MRIVFFGTPLFAVPSLTALLGSREEVVAVVTQPDKRKGRNRILSPPPVKELALKKGIEVLQPKSMKDQGVGAAATKRGLRATAMPDITSRARSVFRLVNGVPTAFEADGQTVRYGRDGVTPMTLEEWVDTQVSDAPHLFESNAGGGAAGNGSGGVGGSNRSVKNPFRKETWNFTEQMKLQKSDPGLAARLRAAA